MLTSMLSGMNNYNRVRMNGMASGMDTQGTIDAMTLSSKNRIVKQWQTIESLKWKQTAYRTQIDMTKKLQNSYFNSLNPTTYLGSSSMFNAFSATSVGGVKVNPTSSTTISKLEISEITQKASASELKPNAGFKASGDVVFEINDFAALKAEMDRGGDKLQVSIDGVVKTVKLTGSTAADVMTSIKDGINAAYGASKVSIDSTGKLTVSGKSQINIAGADYTTSGGTVVYGTEIMKQLGLNEYGISNKLDRYATLGDTNFGNKLQGDLFELSINGVDFKFNKSDTINTIMNTINNSSAGVKMTYSNIDDQFSLTASQSGAGNTLEIKQKTGNLMDSLFGYKEATGTTIATNGLNAGKITSTGNFGGAIPDLLEKGVAITIDGVTKNIYLPRYSTNGDKLKYEDFKNVAANLNDQIKKEFGVSDVTFAVDNYNMTLVSKNNKPVSIGGIVTGTDADGNPQTDAVLLTALGFNSNGQTNKASTSTSLADALGITGDFTFNNGVRNITLNASNTIGQLVQYLNEGGNGVTFDNTTGRLTVSIPAGKKISISDTSASNPGTAASQTAGKALLEKLFGTSVIEQPSTVGSPTVTAGTNAKLVVNGAEIERSSNSFTIDGVNVDISGATIFSSLGTAGVTAGDKLTIDITRNTDATFDTVVKFVDEYNKLVESLNKAVTTKPSRAYQPLTDEQKKEMSDSEIEKWEAKAKEGLLYGDRDIQSMLTQLRTAMYSKPDGSSIALYDIGITTGDYKTGGKLIIDEAKLKKALADNPDGIATLFTSKTDGLAAKVGTIFDKYVKDLGVDKGALVAKAGISNSPTDTKNIISEQIDKYNKTLKVLQQRYADEQNRLWRTFTAMEKAIGSLNSQSGYIQSMFSGGQG